jgi:hypothetical protein
MLCASKGHFLDHPTLLALPHPHFFHKARELRLALRGEQNNVEEGSEIALSSD